MNNKFKVTLL
uniref:Uncharacterized protein n=1 Tax=Arundo donax TaxID=35708 RepID=A0A0A8YQP9_ARUDO